MKLSPRNKKILYYFVTSITATLGTIGVGYFFYTNIISDKNNVAPKYKTTNLNTSYDGKTVDVDSDLIKAKERRDSNEFVNAVNNNKNIIADIDVSKGVYDDKSISDDELLNLDDECFTTGFDSEGYNCDTGFNKNNCNRDGYNPEKKSCGWRLQEETQNKKCSKKDYSESELLALLGLTEDGYDKVTGLNIHGFDRSNCSEQGFTPSGYRCVPLSKQKDDTCYPNTVSYGPDGYNNDNYDIFGCSRAGKLKDGTPCLTLKERMLKIDQEQKEALLLSKMKSAIRPDLNSDNLYDETGCSKEGKTKNNGICVPLSKRIFSPDGIDQFGRSLDDRLNGFDRAFCDINKRDIHNKPCIPYSDMIFDNEGFNQFLRNQNGFDRTLFDKNGCGANSVSRLGTPCIPYFDKVIVNGVDQLGATVDGYVNGYDLTGCSKLNKTADGEDCIPLNKRIFNSNGIDQYERDIDGYKNGYDSNNCSRFGKNPNGEDCEKINFKNKNTIPSKLKTEFFHNKFDGNNCSPKGRTPDGLPCVPEIVMNGLALEKGLLSEEFLNSFGPDGFDTSGCSIKGTNRDGDKCIPKFILDGGDIFKDSADLDDFFYSNGDIFDSTGCSKNGRNINNKPCIPLILKNGVALEKDLLSEEFLNSFGPDGFDSTGCSIKGIDREGKECIPKFILDGGNIFKDNGEIDEFFNSSGHLYDAIGCSQSGRDLNNKPCIPLILKNGVALEKDLLSEEFLNSFGPDGFDSTGCSIKGINREGKECIPKFILDGGNIFKDNASLDNYFDTAFDESGCSLYGRSTTGEPCLPKSFKDGSAFDLGLVNEDFIETFKYEVDETGCTKHGRTPLGEACIPKILTDGTALKNGLLSQEFLDSFGPDGFDLTGCSIKGIDREGKKCIPKFILDGGNIFKEDADLSEYFDTLVDATGCQINGKNFDGVTDCIPEYILNNNSPLIVDSNNISNLIDDDFFDVTGCGPDSKTRLGADCTPLSKRVFEGKYDQYSRDIDGYDLDGFDRGFCSKSLKTPQGLPCIPLKLRVFNSETGLDQFNKTIDNLDLFGFDETGCSPTTRKNINGINCVPLKERIFNGEYDQYGVDINNFDKSGCNVITKINKKGINCKPLNERNFVGLYDQDGIDINNYDKSRCHIYDRVNKNGKPCTPLSERIFTDGYDQNGIDINNKDRSGCNIFTNKLDSGDSCTPLSQRKFDGKYDKDGWDMNYYDLSGCHISKIDKQGLPCIPLSEQNRNNYGDDHYDSNGFDMSLCNRNGLTIEGAPCMPWERRVFDPNTGLDQYGRNKLGYKNGKDWLGRDSEGYLNNYDLSGCSKEGKDKYNRNCTLWALRVFDPVTGLDQFGYSYYGYNSDNKDRHNYDKYTKLDSEGYGPDGFNNEDCNRSMKNRNGDNCAGSVELNISDGELLVFADMLKNKITFMKEMESISAPGPSIVSKPRVEEQKISANEIPTNKKLIQTPTTSDVSISNKVDDTKPIIENKTPNIPAYALMVGRVECAINTDYPDETCIEIKGGPFDGIRLYGDYELPYIDRPEMPRDKVKIKLDRLVYKGLIYPIEAVAVNYSTLNTYMSSDVSYHKLKRWSSVIGAAGVGFGATSLITLLGGEEELSQGASIPLKEISSELMAIYKKPPTVTLDAKRLVGLKFTKPVFNDQLPTY
ncbi:DotG/IcmE/VirB10 family protein [Photobacterium leiognathi]|uniref:DotG/IcmE/VirB10 family protein n=1 Tax=Photobacterium leiognathi TaxID=553611 RepID=UPI0029820676|nr:DotG/IcmE/VirB10 family protein [Photobacterium leiognathi]